ncbi:hypothetical protein ACUODF_39180, partial [Escherichia coli]
MHSVSFSWWLLSIFGGLVLAFILGMLANKLRISPL